MRFFGVRFPQHDRCRDFHRGLNQASRVLVVIHQTSPAARDGKGGHMSEKKESTRRAAIKRIAGKPEMVNLGKVVDLTASGGGSSKDYGGYTIPVYVDNK